MAQPFLAEIRMFGFNFAPVGWALCNGQIMSIAQNTALFSLLGTTFGGDGKSNFGLPNLQGNDAMFWGTGAGLSARTIGQTGGSASVTLTDAQIPAHTHPVSGQTNAPNTTSPAGAVPGTSNQQRYVAVPNPAAGTLNAAALATVGGSQGHNNMQPFLVVNYCIALQGIFPSRS